MPPKRRTDPRTTGEEEPEVIDEPPEPPQEKPSATLTELSAAPESATPEDCHKPPTKEPKSTEPPQKTVERELYETHEALNALQVQLHIKDLEAEVAQHERDIRHQEDQRDERQQHT